MKITLKNIKYSAFASEETHCYEATIYVDGKKFCGVKNGGYGGCDDYYALKGCAATNGSELYKAIAVVNDELNKTVLSTDFGSLKNDLEMECGERMNEWHQMKELNKMLRKITTIKDDEVYTWKVTKAKYRANKEGYESMFKKKGHTLLNTMMPTEAFDLLTEMKYF